MRKFVRVIAILYILFITLFSFDVFSERHTGFELLLALFVHLAPSILVTLVLTIAWKQEKLGGFLYMIIAIFTIIFFKTYQDVVVFTLISLPLGVIGGAFIHLSNNNKQK